MITITPFDQLVAANIGWLDGEHGFRFSMVG